MTAVLDTSLNMRKVFDINQVVQMPGDFDVYNDLSATYCLPQQLINPIYMLQSQD